MRGFKRNFVVEFGRKNGGVNFINFGRNSVNFNAKFTPTPSLRAVF